MFHRKAVKVFSRVEAYTHVHKYLISKNHPEVKQKPRFII